MLVIGEAIAEAWFLLVTDSQQWLYIVSDPWRIKFFVILNKFSSSPATNKTSPTVGDQWRPVWKAKNWVCFSRSSPIRSSPKHGKTTGFNLFIGFGKCWIGVFAFHLISYYLSYYNSMKKDFNSVLNVASITVTVYTAIKFQNQFPATRCSVYTSVLCVNYSVAK